MSTSPRAVNEGEEFDEAREYLDGSGLDQGLDAPVEVGEAAPDSSSGRVSAVLSEQAGSHARSSERAQTVAPFQQAAAGGLDQELYALGEVGGASTPRQQTTPGSRATSQAVPDPSSGRVSAVLSEQAVSLVRSSESAQTGAPPQQAVAGSHADYHPFQGVDLGRGGAGIVLPRPLPATRWDIAEEDGETDLASTIERRRRDLAATQAQLEATQADLELLQASARANAAAAAADVARRQRDILEDVQRREHWQSSGAVQGATFTRFPDGILQEPGPSPMTAMRRGLDLFDLGDGQARTTTRAEQRPRDPLHSFLLPPSGSQASSPTVLKEASESLADLIRESATCKVGSGSDFDRDKESATNSFYTEKSRSRGIANDAAKLLAAGSPKGWPTFGAVGDDHAKSLPKFMQGIPKPTMAFDEEEHGLFWHTREIADLLVHKLGCDGDLLRAILNEIPEFYKPSDAELIQATYVSILKDSRRSGGLVKLGFENVLKALECSLAPNHLSISRMRHESLRNLPHEKQILGYGLAIAAKLLTGYKHRDHALDYVRPNVEQLRDETRTLFSDWLSDIDSMLSALGEIGLVPHNFESDTLSNSFRHMMQKYHAGGNQVVILLSLEQPKLITGPGRIDIGGTLHRAADIERGLASATGLASLGGRPGAKKLQKGTSLFTKGGGGKPSDIKGGLGKLPDKQSREEWLALSPAEKQAVAKRDRERGWRLSHELDAKGDPRRQIFCSGPDGRRGHGWINGSSLKEHKASCEHFNGSRAGIGARGGKSNGGQANVARSFDGECHHCKQKGHRASDCPKKTPVVDTAALLTTLSSQIALLTQSSGRETVSTVPCAAPAATLPSPSTPSTPSAGRRALFSSAAPIAASATALSSVLHQQTTPSPGLSMFMTVGRPSGPEATYTCGFDADEVPSPEEDPGNCIVPDPLGLGTWGPSLPLVTEELVELALDEQSPVRVPRHAWLHTQASSEPERGATTVLDAQRALADFDLAEFAPHRFYTATPEEIMAVAATVAQTSYIAFSSHPDIEAARLYYGAPPFRNRDEEAAFVRKHGIVLDGGANIHCANDVSIVKNVHAAAFTISTVGSPVNTTTAGTLCAHALAKNGKTTVALPEVDIIINDRTNSHSVLGIGQYKDACSNVDSCLDPPRAGNQQAWMTVDDEELLVAPFEGLWYIFVLPLDDDSDRMVHTVAHTSTLESFASSAGPPTFDDIVLQGTGSDAQPTGAMTELPVDVLPTTVCEGLGFTLIRIFGGKNKLNLFFENKHNIFSTINSEYYVNIM